MKLLILFSIFIHSTILLKHKYKEIKEKDEIFTSPNPLYDKTPLLVYKSLYKINGNRNPHKYALNYFNSGKFIDEQEEVKNKII